MQSDTISSDQTYSEIISDLLSTGRTYKFSPEQTRYVCHTSSIPLSTTVDEQRILGVRDDTVGVKHSIEYLDSDLKGLIRYRCCKKHCMYVGVRGGSQPEYLRPNCPCSQITYADYVADEEVEFSLQPLCFLQVLKELRYEFGYVDRSVECDTDEDCCHNKSLGTAERSKTNRPRINFNEVMFCQNSQSILDERYSGPLRDWIGVAGWRDVQSADVLEQILDSTYWFHRFSSVKVRLQMRESCAHGMARTKRVIEQVLYTINGLLQKKFICVPCEMEGYVKLAELTYHLFSQLLDDYLFCEEGIEPSTTNSIFLRMKEVFKDIKEHLGAESTAKRLVCISAMLDGPKYCAFTRFWAYSFRRLFKRIEQSRFDYTTSVSWMVAMTQMSQTRNMGYLPEWVAHFKRKQFRDNISREKDIPTRAHLAAVSAAILRRQREMCIPLKILEDDTTNQEVFREAINSIKLPLKTTASERTTVSKGGKVEDARAFISDAIENHWVIPVYNLRTGKIDSTLEFTPELRETTPAYEGYLFWTALQVVINRFCKDRPHTAKRWNWRPIRLPGSEKWEDTLWNMAIVHISEPGKERNLTKSSSLVAWTMNVCSKVSQTLLAQNQDHRAGLILSAQDWMHQRRVSSESYESYFIYDKGTGLRHDTIWNGFQDWTESTDFIGRQVGGVALQAWLSYIGFPKWYQQIILTLSQVDYKVIERVETHWMSDFGVTRTNYTGMVTEGFMMGNPLTKTILHLMHDVNIGMVHYILESKGIRIVPYSEVADQHSVNLPQWNEFFIDPEHVS